MEVRLPNRTLYNCQSLKRKNIPQHKQLFVTPDVCNFTADPNAVPLLYIACKRRSFYKPKASSKNQEIIMKPVSSLHLNLKSKQ